MTPKTQREKYISSLATLLRPITNNQLEYAKKHCFYHYAVKNGKHLHCTECCHDWYSDTINKTIVCPHCGKRLKIKHSQKRTFHFSSYLCVTSKLKEFQVFRYFLVDKSFYIKKSVNYYVNEVAQFWCDASGKTTIFARNRKMFAYYSNSPWDFFKPMTLKRIGRYDARYDICPSATIVKSVLPILKRNGFSSQLCGMNPKEYCNTILTSPQHETLLKEKQYSAFRYFTTDNIERYWSSLKIALRNKYIIKDAQLWRDMIDSLQYCGADIHNAKFVCPLDLKKTHDMWSAKVSKIRQKRFEEERMKRAKENEQKFIQSKGKYFDIAFNSQNIYVSVLSSIAEYMEEGKCMHHCVFSNEYFAKEGTLVLSAKDKENNRLATIEISLSTFKILQCRAAYNKVPTDKDKIERLVRRNIGLFKKASA